MDRFQIERFFRLFVDPETFEAIDKAKARERRLGLPMTILGLVVTHAGDGVVSTNTDVR